MLHFILDILTMYFDVIIKFVMLINQWNKMIVNFFLVLYFL